MFELLSKDPATKARTGRLRTDHGDIPTPVFMPVGTNGSVKAVSQDDLADRLDARIILGNTYHLFLRPGMSVMREAGGLHRFIGWDRAILTDSGGYQIFSLAGMRKLEERGARFKSHLDGSEHWFTPENVVHTQRTLGSDIVMILDECPPWPATREYVLDSMRLTHRWAERGRREFEATEPLYGHRQFQFGILQGGTFPDLRRESAEFMAEQGFEGLAIGGLSVGEPVDLLYDMTDKSTDHLPQDKPRYLMGVGTPANLLECVARGVDMFDCVMPTRNARNGMIFTPHGIVNLRNAGWRHHHRPFDPDFPTDLCSRYSMSYIHHLFRCGELLGLELASEHNLAFYLWLMRQVRERIADGTFGEWYGPMARTLESKVKAG